MKQALFLVLLFTGGLLSAQSNLKLQFEPQTPRRVVDLKTEYTEVTICGLEVGQTYSIASGYISSDDPCSFEIGVSKTSFSRNVMFVADESCETFWFRKTCDGNVSAYMSLYCNSCAVKEDKDTPEQGVVTDIFNGDLLSLIKDNFIGGNCFDVSNVVFSGGATQLGTFSNGTGAMGLETGIILSSGNVNLAQGPNTSGNASAVGGGGNSDPDLNGLTPQALRDVAVLEFDFIPTTDVVQFDFVFGSEEYCEWVNTEYNDVFGFFISGPGISGSQNIALLPTGEAITINTVNNGANSAYFVPNSTGCGAGTVNDEIEYDGYTTVLTAIANIPDTSCQTYHLRLGIADGTDAHLDSGVFLKKGSFNAGAEYEVTASDLISGTDETVEGCGDAFFRFSLFEESKYPTTITFTISGTATSGVDYSPLPTTVVIPAETKYVDLPVTIFADGIPEGLETIELLIDANVCSCLSPTIVLNIIEPDPILVQQFDTVLCEGSSGSLVLDPNVEGGAPPLTYDWSNGSTMSSINVPSGTGTYSVTVTDACGGTEEAVWNITESPAPTVDISGDGSICDGGFVDIDLSFTGIGPWTVEIYKDGALWNTMTFLTANAVFSVTEVGVYTVPGVSTSSCDGFGYGVATITEATLQTTAIVSNELCAGQDNGSIEVLPINPGSYTYTWSPSQPDNPLIENLSPGLYELTISDASGCTAIETYDVFAATPMTVDSFSTEVNCLNPSDGTIDLLAGGGQPGYTYTWDNGANTASLFGLTAGTYYFTVTDANNCEVTGSETVEEGDGFPVANIEPASMIDCNNSTISLSGNGSSTSAGTSYSWVTTDGNIVSGSTTLSPVIDMGGTYTLIVTNALGCVKDTSVTVLDDLIEPIANVAALGELDCSNPSMTLVDNGSSAGSDFSYLWTTADGHIVSGNTSLTPVVNSSGTYTLVVTNDVNGCTATVDVPVTGDTISPIAMINSAGVLSCVDSVITLDGVGSSTGSEYTYNWTTSDGNIISGADALNPVINQQGAYTLVVANSNNGCTSSESVLVAQNLDVATPDAGDATTIGCAQTSVILNGSILPSNATFEWVTLNGNIVGGATTLSPEVNSHGDYTLIATHPVSGCTSESTVTVGLDQDVPVANAGTGVDITCNTPTISLDGSNSSQGANYTYNWSTTDGNIVSGGTTLNPTVDTSGVYQLMVTDNANGCTSLSSVTIGLNNQPPSVEPGLPATIDCNSPIVTLGPSAPSGNANLTYTWTTVDGNIVAGAATENPQVNSDGLYDVVVTDNTNGCTSTGQVLIDEDLNYPTVGLVGDDEITCTAASATITAAASSTGSLTYNWTTTDGFIQFGNGTNAITVNQAGTYAVDIVNTDNGCSVQDSFDVSTNADFPNAVAAEPSELTCLVDTVEIYGTGSSSGSQFVYSWTTADGNIISASNILDVVVDQPGTYILGVTDITNNCASSFAITVNENLETPTADAGLTQTLLCGVDSLQLAGVGSANGGSVEYAWTTQNGSILSGNNTTSPFVNASGTYYLNVTNSSNGCSAMDSVIIDQDVNIPTVDAGPDLMINCQVNSVELGTTNTASGSNFSYQWTASNGGGLPAISNTPFLTVTDGGTYELLVTNTDNGCKAVSVVDVEKNVDLPVIDPGLPSELNCLADTTLVGGLGSSAGAEFSYAWTTPNGNIVSGNSSSQALVNAPGDYVLVITNTQNFCESQMNISVTEDVVEPSISMGSPSLITCTTPTVDLSANGSSAGSEFDYLWSTTSGNIVSGEMSLTPTVNQPGVYTLLITNSLNGCSAIDSVEVDKDNSQPTALIEPVAKLTCDVSEIMIDATNSSAGSNFTYSWTTANGTILSGGDALNPTISSPGDYHLVVLDNSNNCTSFADVTVNEDIAPPISEAGPNATIYCGDTKVALDGTGTDVGASFVYQWTTLDGNIVSGATTLYPEADEVGTYYLAVENTTNGCQAVDSVVVVADVNAPVIVVANSPQLTCDVTEIVIDATNSSSGADFDYSWSTGNGHIVAGGKSNSPTIDKEGKYLLTLTNTLNGCETTKEVNIEQNIEEPVVAGAVNDMLTCKLDEVDISASATGSGTLFDFQWSSTGGNIVSGDLTPSPKVNLKGIYTVIVKDLSNGCTSEKSFVVEENKLAPDLALANPEDITCKQTTVVLNASSSNNDVSYNWTALTGNIVSGANSATPVVNQTGDYEVDITDNGNGCTALKIVSVSENVTKPIADAGQDFDIPCSSNSVQIGPAIVNPDYIYSWSTSTGNIVSGANSSNPLVSAVGSYLLQVENKENGCVEDDDMYVAAPPKVLDLAFDIEGVVCNGAGGSIKIVSVTGGTPPYLFSFDNGSSFGALDVQNGLVSGSYNVVVQDVMGCEHEAYAIVPSADLPVVETNSIYYIESGDSAQLQVFTSILPDDIDTIIWDPIEYLSCTNCLNPIAKPLVSTNYEVEVIDKNGCDASARIAIFVSDPDIYIPNVFSPNSNNLENSSFYIHAKPNKVKEITALSIFDRWGNQVFIQEHFLPNDPYAGWDGTFRELELEPGVYVYHAVVEFVSGKKVSYAGDVTIVK